MKTLEYGVPAAAGAFLVPTFEFLYGSGEVRFLVMVLLALLIFMDWLSGIRAAKIDNSYSSEYGLAGIWRTAFILFLPAIGHLLDRILNLQGVIFGLFAFGIIYHVLNSMTANSVRAGWGKWIPNQVIEWVSSEIQKKIQRSNERKGTQ